MILFWLSSKQLSKRKEKEVYFFTYCLKAFANSFPTWLTAHSPRQKQEEVQSFRWTINNLLPVGLREVVAGVLGTTGDWDVPLPVSHTMNATAPKLYKEQPTTVE